mmetsp:Transcript_151049/g.263215  ORF Transcript_151049/g.263215 Transcript_151049/m.263215 type:complete len:97 (+) Transcript_151049:1155-1445(+)
MHGRTRGVTRGVSCGDVGIAATDTLAARPVGLSVAADIKRGEWMLAVEWQVSTSAFCFSCDSFQALPACIIAESGKHLHRRDARMQRAVMNTSKAE